MTPRPPISPSSQPGRKTGLTNAQRRSNALANPGPRRAPPPTGLLTGLDSSDDDTNPARGRKTLAKVTHQVQKPKPAAAAKNDIPVPSLLQPSAFSKVSSSSELPSKGSKSLLKKYGVEPTDRGDYFTRQGNSSRQSSDQTSDSWLQPSSPQDVGMPRKSSNGAAIRTRSTLDHLLSNTDDHSSHDLLGHIGRGAPAKRQEMNSSRQKVSVTQSQARG